MRIDALRPMISARLAVVPRDATLRTAAFFLSDPRIGLIVVCDDNGRAAGVVSRSDLVRHLMRLSAAEAPVSTLMSRNIVSCRPEDDLYTTWQRMGAQSLQKMPLLSTDSKPLGVLDIRDALEALFEREEYQERLLFDYVFGVGYQ